MRHRICNLTGFGSSEPIRLDNNINIHKNEFWNEFLKDVQLNFKTIDKYEGFDFHITSNSFTFGIEPSYKFDDLQIIHFDFNNKQNCYIEQGRAWGYYGSHCVTKTKKYSEYKNKSKFIRFIDKWFDLISFECKRVVSLHCN